MQLDDDRERAQCHHRADPPPARTAREGAAPPCRTRQAGEPPNAPDPPVSREPLGPEQTSWEQKEPRGGTERAQRTGTADGVAPPGQLAARLGSPLRPPWDWGPDPLVSLEHGAGSRDGHWCWGKAGEGGDMGESGPPSPRPPWQRPGTRESRTSLSRLAGGPLAATLMWEPAGICLFRRGSPSLQLRAQLVGGKGLLP